MYENFEYMPASSSDGNDTEKGQFFIIENDGTLTISRQPPMQYETELSSVDRIQHPCSESEVHEQYYSHLNSHLNDVAYTIPEDQLLNENAGKTSENSFLMQYNTMPPLELHQCEPNEMCVEEQVPMEIMPDNTTITCESITAVTTEITLSEEQWKIIQQNGWILLELNNKIYLLDTLGLHDITNNEELITNLKNEIAYTSLSSEMNQETFTYEVPNEIGNSIDLPDAITMLAENPVNNPNNNPENPIYNITEPLIINTITKPQNINDTPQEVVKEIVLPIEKNVPAVEVPPAVKPPPRVVIRNRNKAMRFKTNLSIEDIPDKLILGTTVNGKRLVARAVKRPAGKDRPVDSGHPNEGSLPTAEEIAPQISHGTQTDRDNKTLPSDSKKHKTDNLLPNDKEPEKLSIDNKTLLKDNTQLLTDNGTLHTQTEKAEVVNDEIFKVTKDYLKDNDFSNVNSAIDKKEVDVMFNKFIQKDFTAPEKEDIEIAGFIINQLLTIKSTRSRLVGQNILLTRSRHEHVKGSGKVVKNPIYVSGRVSINPDDKEWSFSYEPELLHRLMSQNNSRNASGKQVEYMQDVIVYLHVTEAKQADGLTKTTITITKQHIRLYPRPRRLVHACSSCAMIFEDSEALLNHRKKPCVEEKFYDDTFLTIDAKEIQDYYTFTNVPGLKKKCFVCIYCKEKVKLYNLKRHLQSHTGPPDRDQSDGGGEKQLHKCHMCASAYFYKSTLSKHILTSHIKKDIKHIVSA